MFKNKKKFEILVIGCVIFLTMLGLYRIITGKKGSWSSYLPLTHSSKFSTTTPIHNPNFGIKSSSESKGEIECRRVLRNMFGLPFNKDRPNFLRNEVTGGNNLELDCYSPELGLAIEYNGIQHYKYIPYFHKNKEAFLNQKYRDEIKRRMCKDNNVILIEVPYTVKLHNIESYLYEKLMNYKTNKN